MNGNLSIPLLWQAVHYLYFRNMTMNPRNIIKLLQIAFDQPKYDNESAISENERTFSLQLETIIKDAINDSLFVEVYEKLQFNDPNSLPPSLPIEEDQEFTIDKKRKVDTHSSEDEDITMDYKQKAVDFWKSGKNKLKFESVRARFKRLKHNNYIGGKRNFRKTVLGSKN